MAIRPGDLVLVPHEGGEGAAEAAYLTPDRPFAGPMSTTDDRAGLRFGVDLRHCQLTATEMDRLRADLDCIERQVAKFPHADLRVLVEYNARTTDYSVKTSLLLPGATLVANDHDLVMHAAYQRCLAAL